MCSRNAVLVSLSVILGFLLLATVPQLLGQGEQPPPFANRYHATAAGQTGAVFVCDTMTGECWYGSVGVKWRSLGKPGDQKAGEEATLIIPRR
jgi:hypothetical protein